LESAILGVFENGNDVKKKIENKNFLSVTAKSDEVIRVRKKYFRFKFFSTKKNQLEVAGITTQK